MFSFKSFFFLILGILLFSSYFCNAQNGTNSFDKECVKRKQLSSHTSTVYQEPHMANSGEIILVVYTKIEGGSSGISGRLISTKGKLINNEFTISIFASDSLMMRPQVIATGEFTFFVSWQKEDEVDSAIHTLYGTIVTLHGYFNDPSIGPFITIAQGVHSLHRTAYNNFTNVIAVVYDKYGFEGNSTTVKSDHTNLFIHSLSGENPSVEFDSSNGGIIMPIDNNTDYISYEDREPDVIANGNGFMAVFDYGDLNTSVAHNIVALRINAPNDGAISFPDGGTAWIIGNSIYNSQFGHDHHPRVSYSSVSNIFLCVWEVDIESTTDSFIAASSFATAGFSIGTFQNVAQSEEFNFSPEIAYNEGEDQFYIVYEAGGLGESSKHDIAATILHASDLDIAHQVNSVLSDVNDRETQIYPAIVSSIPLDGFIVSWQYKPTTQARNYRNNNNNKKDNTQKSSFLLNEDYDFDDENIQFVVNQNKGTQILPTVEHDGSGVMINKKEKKEENVMMKRQSSNGNGIEYVGFCGPNAVDDDDDDDYSNFVLLYPLFMLLLVCGCFIIVLFFAIILMLSSGDAKEQILTTTSKLSTKAKGEDGDDYFDSSDSSMQEL